MFYCVLQSQLSFKSAASIICFSEKRKRSTYDDLYDNEEVRNAVMEQAKDIQANLDPQFPSFIKFMLRSHVTGGFWLVNYFLSILAHFQSEITSWIFI